MTTFNSTNTPNLTTNGQIIVGKTGSNPIIGTFASGAGINVSFNSSTGVFTFTALDAGFNTVVVTSASQSMAVATQYLTNGWGGGLVTFTLPTSANVGDTIRVIGSGISAWTILLNSGQYIIVGAQTTTLTTGNVHSTTPEDGITLVCTVSGVEFTAVSSMGNLQVT